VVEVRHILVSEHIPVVTALMRAHQLETEPGMGTPNPSIEAYKAMEHAATVIALGAFDNEVMVGYIVMFTGEHHHYGTPFAQHDVLFVRDDMRDTGLGLRLIRNARALSKERGAQFIAWHAKPGSALAQILEKQGCTLEDAIYIERF
jgi:predicted GNAT superfamily acetyltransferase